MGKCTFRPARADDLPALEQIRQAAFAPIFDSFRRILGDVIYEAAQAREDRAQSTLLESLLQPGSGWEVHLAEAGATIVGFVSLQANRETKVGEIGLNAVHPAWCRRGIGAELYELALDRMRQAGMKVATVATGGDPSHAPARSAYRKAGFSIEIPSVWMCREL